MVEGKPGPSWVHDDQDEDDVPACRSCGRPLMLRPAKNAEVVSKRDTETGIGSVSMDLELFCGNSGCSRYGETDSGNDEAPTG